MVNNGFTNYSKEAHGISVAIADIEKELEIYQKVLEEERAAGRGSPTQIKNIMHGLKRAIHIARQTMNEFYQK